EAVVGVRCELRASVKALLEGEADRRAVRLEPATCRRRFPEWAGLFHAVVVEHQDVRREGVCRAELATEGRQLVVVAPARQTASRLQDKHIELFLAPLEGDRGGEVQALGKDLHLEALGHDDVLAVSGIEEHGLLRASGIGRGENQRGARRRYPGQNQRGRNGSELGSTGGRCGGYAVEWVGPI